MYHQQQNIRTIDFLSFDLLSAPTVMFPVEVDPNVLSETFGFPQDGVHHILVNTSIKYLQDSELDDVV